MDEGTVMRETNNPAGVTKETNSRIGIPPVGVTKETNSRMRKVLSSRDATRLMNATLANDMVRKFPSLEGLCDRDLMVIMGVALGFSYRRIGKALKLSLGTVHNIVNRIDPDGLYRLDRDAMAEYVANRARSLASEVLSEVDLEKLDGEPQKQVDVAKKLSEIANLNERAKGSGDDSKVRKVVVEFVGAGNATVREGEEDITDAEFQPLEERRLPEVSESGTAMEED